jgi:hypothetical protein
MVEQLKWVKKEFHYYPSINNKVAGMNAGPKSTLRERNLAGYKKQIYFE